MSKTFGILLIAVMSGLAHGAAAETRLGTLARASLGDLEVTAGRGATVPAPSIPSPTALEPTVTPNSAVPTGASPDGGSPTDRSAGGQTGILAPGGSVTVVGDGGSFRASNRIADGAFLGAHGIVTAIQNVGNNVTIQNVTSVTINIR